MRPRWAERSASVLISFAALALIFLAAPIFLRSLEVQAQSIRGQLLDNESRQPIVNGTITLVDTLGFPVARVLSDSEGRFLIVAPRPGRYTLRGGGLGYRGGLQPRYDLREGEELPADIYLVPAPLEMEPLEVSAERVRSELERQGFFRRRELRRGFFLAPGQLSVRPPITEAEVISRAPFVEVDRSWSGSRIKMRRFGRPCDPMVFVDDFEVRGGNIEDHVNAADIIAVEVYRGFSEIPQELAIGQNNTCGVVMIWTVWSEARSKKRGGG